MHLGQRWDNLTSTLCYGRQLLAVACDDEIVIELLLLDVVRDKS
jgi:hypothetical protein